MSERLFRRELSPEEDPGYIELSTPKRMGSVPWDGEVWIGHPRVRIFQAITPVPDLPVEQATENK